MSDTSVRVIGLISGTSVDGIDAALVEIEGKDWDLRVQLLAGETYSYPQELREQILAVCAVEKLSMEELATLDDAIAASFAKAAQNIQIGHPPADLIGSHGQTVFHRPPSRAEMGKWGEGLTGKLGYSLQLGRGDAIAQLTGITTVSNFRSGDIALGGEGAPLVPKVDACLLSHPTKVRCVQNLGGIGNVTYLPPRSDQNWEDGVYGWDTGPSNALLDLAVEQFTHGKQSYDAGGCLASQGTPCQDLVNLWLQQDFFQQAPPKSTGRELFSPEYLQQCYQDAQSRGIGGVDWLATLTELTVASVVHSYRNFLPRMPDEVFLCGGGACNSYLKERMSKLLNPIPVLTTDDVGLSRDFKEAIAFAVLAHWRFNCNFPGNLPLVTGAREATLLGEVWR